MITYGGWNSPRWPESGHSGEAWFAAWEAWNQANAAELRKLIAVEEKKAKAKAKAKAKMAGNLDVGIGGGGDGGVGGEGDDDANDGGSLTAGGFSEFRGFDGLDWDMVGLGDLITRHTLMLARVCTSLSEVSRVSDAQKRMNESHVARLPPYDTEGNDDPASERNVLDVASLDLFGSLSVAMKRGGYLTTMVPPESYLDPTDDRFDTRLNLTYDGEFDGVYFPHHGRNCYAYLLAKYGYTEVHGVGSGPSVHCFIAHLTHSVHTEPRRALVFFMHTSPPCLCKTHIAHTHPFCTSVEQP